MESGIEGTKAMKVISIVQPWATLIALVEKKYETRSWATKYRGPLAIHASKKINKEACRWEPIRSVLAKHDYSEKNLPTGAIIATTRLADCIQVTQDFRESLQAELEGGILIHAQEYLFGGYSTGRYAWELTDVERLPAPIPAKGRLGLWEYSI